jgi:hypothetical protein
VTSVSNITIVGAGPFGLSIAAHLSAYGEDFRIIGSPMHNWLTKMPQGMLLKSAGFASTLYDPGRTFTLRQYCKEHGFDYEDLDHPIPLEIFCSYGVAFQQRFAPNLENENVESVTTCPEGFELRTNSGKSFKTRKLVLAAGIDYFRYVPKLLAHLPPDLCTHSAEHHDLQGFRGSEVAIIGAGASATDLAILLHECGAKVKLIARTQELVFGGPWGGASRPLLRRIRAPISGIGPGWRSLLCTHFPGLYRHLPERVRLRTVKSHLGAAGGWFMKERAEAVPTLLGYSLSDARAKDGRVHLRLASAGGARRNVLADHVIAATGYRPDIRRLPFLSVDILEKLQLAGRLPRLSAHFESSVPGLYFAGPITAASFGPVMRFAAGADFTSRRISKHLMRSLPREVPVSHIVEPTA